MLGKFFDRTLHFKITGPISDKTYQHIISRLNSTTENIHLVAVSVNSTGGSMIQAKNINSALHKFALQNGAPVYTFAEDLVLNSANLILLSGHRVYANKFSLIGDFGFSRDWIGLKNFLNSKGVKFDPIHAGETKAKLNPFKNLDPKDVEWFQKIQTENGQALRQEIFNLRKPHFEKKKLNLQKIEKKIFDGPDLRSKD